MPQESLSEQSLAEANRDRAKFSGHGNALGAAGYVPDGHQDVEMVSAAQNVSVVNPQEEAFGTIRIAAKWHNIVVEEAGGLLEKMVKQATRQGVDIDLGCLYELEDGTRGCVQAFGELMGAFDEAPYIALSGDDRTGGAEGVDEFIRVNGAHWGEIRRLLVYAYIYDGAASWAAIKPHIRVVVPGADPIKIVPDVRDSDLCVCTVALIENQRNGIKLTHLNEYFPGHAEMDRAFGFGLAWADGQKDSA